MKEDAGIVAAVVVGLGHGLIWGLARLAACGIQRPVRAARARPGRYRVTGPTVTEVHVDELACMSNEDIDRMLRAAADAAAEGWVFKILRSP